LFSGCCTQVQPDLQQAVEVDNEEATDNLRNQLAAYCEVRAVVAGYTLAGLEAM
jgi:phytoene/squalene synthetase